MESKELFQEASKAKKYVKPTLMVEEFVPNECVSVCYTFYCNFGSYDKLYEESGTNGEFDWNDKLVVNETRTCDNNSYVVHDLSQMKKGYILNKVSQQTYNNNKYSGTYVEKTEKFGWQTKTYYYKVDVVYIWHHTNGVYNASSTRQHITTESSYEETTSGVGKS